MIIGIREKWMISIVLALLVKLAALLLVDLLWISIPLYALFVLLGFDRKLTISGNFLMFNFPFLFLHALPLAIHHHLFSFYSFDPPHDLFNYAALMAYTQICILFCLLVRIKGIVGLIYTLVFVFVISIGFRSWSLQVFIAGIAFLSLATFMSFPSERTFFQRFLFLFLPFFFIYILSPIWEPLFMGGELAQWNIKILPTMVVVPIAILIGLSLQSESKVRKYLCFVLVIFLFALAGRLNMTWIAFVSQDKTQRELIASFELIDYYGDTIYVSTTKGDLLVLNFWSTSCGVCIEKFPQIEKLYREFLFDPRVSFYSVNIPLPRDTKEFIYSLNEGFETQLLFGDDELRNKLGVYRYPTMIIIKNGVQKYHGITVFDSFNYYDPSRIINRLLKEE